MEDKYVPARESEIPGAAVLGSPDLFQVFYLWETYLVTTVKGQGEVPQGVSASKILTLKGKGFTRALSNLGKGHFPEDSRLLYLSRLTYSVRVGLKVTGKGYINGKWPLKDGHLVITFQDTSPPIHLTMAPTGLMYHSGLLERHRFYLKRSS